VCCEREQLRWNISILIEVEGVGAKILARRDAHGYSPNSVGI